MSSETKAAGKSAAPFVSHLEPFFYGRPITCLYKARLATVDGFLNYHFGTVVWAKKMSVFAVGAQSADAVLDRYGTRRGDLYAALGDGPYGRFVSDAAITYTRVGRYADARRLLDAEIDAGRAELLLVRAEVSWIHDPEQAAADLAAVRGRAGRQRRSSLLRRHLLLNVLDRTESALPGDPVDGEFGW